MKSNGVVAGMKPSILAGYLVQTLYINNTLFVAQNLRVQVVQNSSTTEV